MDHISFSWCLNVNTSCAEPPLIGSAASKSKGKVEGSRNYLWLVVIALLNIREGWETFLSIGGSCNYLWLMFNADLVPTQISRAAATLIRFVILDKKPQHPQFYDIGHWLKLFITFDNQTCLNHPLNSVVGGCFCVLELTLDFQQQNVHFFELQVCERSK